MPKIIAHALSGATIIVATCPKANVTKWTLLAGAVLAVSPDFDFAVEWLLKTPDFHRGLTHSFLFSLVTGLVICIWMDIEYQRLALAYSLAFLSHSILDTVTSTEGGVKLFYPLSDNYYHLGLTKILELPAGPNPREILTWILIETVIFLPIFLVVLFIKRSFD